MRYYCKIKKIDNEEITIDIQGYEIICFCNIGCDYNVGDKVICELTFYDDIVIKETNESKKIERIIPLYSYRIIGVLDVDKQLIKSLIDFSLEESDIWNVSYLDKKMVEVSVPRIDIEFI